MSDHPVVSGLHITPDKQVREITLTSYEDYAEAIGGYIEAISLIGPNRTEFTMWCDEEFLLKYNFEQFNSIASDICGISGRLDLMLTGVLGPVLIVGATDPEGYDTSLPPAIRVHCNRVIREAVL